MIKLFFLLTIVTSSLLFGCVSSKSVNRQTVSEIIIENNSSTKLTDKPIAIKRSAIKKIPDGTIYPLVLSPGNDTIPSQLDDLDGDNKWDEIFFVANLAADSKTTYSLRWISTKPAYDMRTSVRFGKRLSANTPVQPATNETAYQRDLPKSLGFQRYQTDGPSWENDKVGFRHYLDGRNAKDVFGKRTPQITPETVGINSQGAVEDNYHVMEDWGRDILAVGNSIGIGGVALVELNQLFRLGVTVDDSVNNVENTTFNIVSEGPVRSVISFKYAGWKPLPGRNYKVEETTTITPGIYAFHNTVKVSGLSGKENLGIGMVNINSNKQPTEIKVGNKWVALINHDKHTYNKEWWLGLALILPADSYLGYIEAPKTGKLSNTFLAKVKISADPVSYYAVAAWEGSEDGFKDEAYFRQYVEDLVRQLTADVKLSVK